MKAYSRFYQFAYVTIYRALKSAAQQAAQQAEAQQIADLQAADDVSFDPISTSPSRPVSDEFAPAFIRCSSRGHPAITNKNLDFIA